MNKVGNSNIWDVALVCRYRLRYKQRRLLSVNGLAIVMMIEVMCILGGMRNQMRLRLLCAALVENWLLLHCKGSLT